MKTLSMTAALLLAAPPLAFSTPYARASEVRMYESPPSVEQLQEDLAPHRTRSIEIAAPAAAPAPSPASHPAAYVPSEAPAASQKSEAAPQTEAAKPAAGTPRHAAARTPVTVGFHIQFAFDSADILAQSRPFLDQLGKVLAAEPRLSVVVEGHTDATGGDAYNLALSKRRAESVKAYLTQVWKVAPERLTVEGKGKGEPLVTNPYAPENRRVQFRPLTQGETSAGS
jgi:OmpA-OmpF porin, OOP family